MNKMKDLELERVKEEERSIENTKEVLKGECEREKEGKEGKRKGGRKEGKQSKM